MRNEILLYFFIGLFCISGSSDLGAVVLEQVNTNSPQTITNKTFNSPTTINSPSIASPTVTSPTITGTTSIGAGATLTSPSINTPTITSPSITGTVGGAGTYTGPILDDPILTRDIEASLPASTTEAKLIWLDDGPQGLIGDFGTKLAHMFGYNWIADAYTDCNVAITAIGATQATIIIQKNCAFPTTVTTPTTLTVQFEGQGQISPATGIVVTISGPIVAPKSRKIFNCVSGEGCVQFSKGKTIYPEWYGAVGDDSTDNTQAFVSMHRSVTAMGGYVRIFYQSGKTYNYSPQNTYTVANTWRAAVEFVNVKFVTLDGYGAELKSVVPNTWKIGDTAVNFGNEESAIQFRALTTQGLGSDIVIKGLKITGVRLSTPVVTDGAAGGIMLRGMQRVKIIDVNLNNWSMDGFYAGMAYSNAFGGTDITLKDSVVDLNQRNGVSIVKNDKTKILGNSISNTNGGSFGHGVDLEPNTTFYQSDIQVTGNYFKDNERGALNIIRTNDVIFHNNILDEQRALTVGAIYVDSGGDASNYTSRISIRNNIIKTLKASLYVNGSFISDLEFTDNNVLTTGDVNSAATIRILNGTNHRDFTVSRNKFRGNGGLNVSIQEGTFFFEGNDWLLSKKNAATPLFTLTTGNGNSTNFAVIKNNRIEMDSTMVNADTDLYCVNGVMEGNIFIGTAAATFHFTETGGGRTNATMRILHNDFSQFFYMKGAVANLDIKSPGAVLIQELTLTGVTYRVVHGGLTRTASGISALVNDLTYEYSASGGGAILYKATVAGSPGTWVTEQVAP